MCIMKSSLTGRYRNKNKNSLEQMRYNQYQDLPWSFEIIRNRDRKNEETNVGILDGCFSTFIVLTSSPLDVTATNMNPLNSCLLKTGDWPDYFYKFQYLRKYKLFMLQVIIEIIHLCFGVKYGPHAAHPVWLIYNLFSLSLVAYFTFLGEQFMSREYLNYYHVWRTTYFGQSSL